MQQGFEQARAGGGGGGEAGFELIAESDQGINACHDAVLFGGELAEADDTSCGESTSGVEAGVWVMWSDWAAVNYSVDAISLE